MKRGYAIWGLCLLMIAVGSAQAQVELRLVCTERTLRTEPMQVVLEAVVPEGTALGAVQTTVQWDPVLVGLVSLRDGDLGALSINERTGALDLAVFNAAGKSGTFALAHFVFHDMQVPEGSAEIGLNVIEVTAAGDFADLLEQTTAVPCTIALSLATEPLARLSANGRQEVLAGDALIVRVGAALAEGVALGAVDATLRWNPRLLALLDVEGGDFAPLNERPGDARAGQWSFSAFNAEGAADGVELAALHFQTRVDTAGLAEVELQVSELTSVGSFANLLPHATVESYTGSVQSDSLARPPVALWLVAPDSAAPGERIEVEVQLTMPEGVALGAVDFALRWDAENLDFVKFEQGEFAPFNVRATERELVASAFDAQGRGGQFALGWAVFRAGDAGVAATQIELEVRELTAAGTFADYTNWMQVSGSVLAVIEEDPVPPVDDRSFVVFGQTLEATLTTGRENRPSWFINVPSRQMIAFEMYGDFDAYLRLYAEEATSHLASNRKRDGRRARIERILEAGIYRIEASAWRDQTTGSFQLVVSPELVGAAEFVEDGFYFEEGGRTLHGQVETAGEEGRRSYLLAVPTPGFVKLTLESGDFRPQVRLHYTVVPAGFPVDRTQIQSTRANVGVSEAGFQRYLRVGLYRVEACSYRDRETGSYALRVERGRIVRRKKVVADGLPEVASLLGAYPNPFNPSTMISYALSSAGVVHLEVYDVLGQRVRLLSAGYRDAGRHQVVWDGRDEEGMSVSTGMYLVRLNAGDYRSVEKISLLR